MPVVVNQVCYAMAVVVKNVELCCARGVNHGVLC